jgi:hypothetical protein
MFPYPVRVSEIATLDTEPRLVSGAGLETTRRVRQPPEALWAACVAAQVAVAALLTSYTYFFFDDFLFLRQAQTQGFGRGYLAEGLFQHFSPITRVLNKAIVKIDPGSFAFAHAVQLALYACAITAFAFVVRTILGRTWLAFGLTVVFGQSVFLLRLLNWWTATANLLPATIGMLVALGCYLRWQRGGSRRWLIGSLIAFAGALLDYETAMLFPGYLLLIRLLILEDSLDPRRWARVLWQERWSWLAYFALDAAAVINYYTRYYVAMPRPSLGQLVHFVEIGLVQSFVPALFGVARQPTPGTSAVLATGLCMCVLAAVTLYLRPRAWRCLLAAVIAFLLSLVPLGLNRIELFGVYVGAELYYQQSAQFMFLVCVAFAWTPRFAGPPRRLELERFRPAAVATMVLVVAVGYGALYVSSVHALANGAWEPRTARSYFDRFLADVAKVRDATGSDPNLIDSTVGTNLMPTSFAPFNRYSWFFPVITPHLRYDQVSSRSFIVDPAGALERVRFASERTGLLHGRACVAAGNSPIRIRLNRPMRSAGSNNGHVSAVEVSYLLPLPQNAQVLAGPVGQAAEPVDGDAHPWGQGPGSSLAVIESPMPIGEVDVSLPAGGCVTRLAVGAFVPQHR